MEQGPIEEYLAEVAKNLRGNRRDKEAILAELRSHLEERVTELLRHEPTGQRDDVERRVAGGFGNPRDLALAYGAEGPELRHSSGEIIVRVTRAVGRGTGKLLKWTAIGGLVLLVLALIVGVWAWYEVRPVVEDLVPYEVYSLQQECDVTSCGPGPMEERFALWEGTNAATVDATVTHANEVGSVRVVLVDPEGVVRYDHTFRASDGPLAHSATLPVALGGWTARYEYVAFQGTLDVSVTAVGLPRD